MADQNDARITAAVKLLKRGKITKAGFARRVQEILDDAGPRKKPAKRKGKRP